MIALWLLYATTVAALAGGAALALEHALRTRRWPARWVWAGAMVLSVWIPAAALLAPSGDPAGIVVDAQVGAALPAADFAPFTAAAGSASWLRRFNRPLAWLTAAAGAAGLLWLAASAISLRARMRRWLPADVDGVRVLVSEDVGPAVIGVLRSRIVLPRWALALPAEARRLMLAHETEHQRARDPLLLLGAVVLAALFSWNLPLWWQLRRLRLAVEVDCDARVLAGFPDVRSYGAVLLDVGRHSTRRITAAAALTEPLGFLERRIRIMTADDKTVSPLRLLGFAALAALLVAGACELAEPSTPQPWTPTAGRDGAGPEPSIAGDFSLEPTFTPYEVQPELRNRAEFVQALEQNFPGSLKDAGVGGTVRLWVFIDEAGNVANTQLVKPSEQPLLDEAAMAAVRILKFSPALNRDKRVPVWIQFPVRFQVPAADTARADVAEQSIISRPYAPPARSVAQPVADGPVFTPFEKNPEILNRDEYIAALERNYPKHLKEAGIAGTVRIWLFIGATGKVDDVRLVESSGTPALDKAAMAAAGRLEFSPALNRGAAVPVWIQFPVAFQSPAVPE